MWTATTFYTKQPIRQRIAVLFKSFIFNLDYDIISTNDKENTIINTV